VRGARVSDAAEFRGRAGPLLERDELRHTVPLGVLSTLERDPTRYAKHHLWVVEDAGAVGACAMMTPPFHLLVAGHDQAALEELAATVRGDGVPVPGVNGFVPEAEEFAACWARVTGTTAKRSMSLRMYSTTSVTPAPATPGEMRTAGESDRSVLAEWAHAFADETGLQGGPGEIARSILARVGADPGIVVWEVGGAAVAMAGASVSSPGIARVGPVYTPPEHRRHGYATSLVAAWTDALLGRSIRRCALFTDLANPTSNSIYQAVGYRPVADAVEIDFI
jgi:predicted GNAT family acetyltransferase